MSEMLDKYANVFVNKNVSIKSEFKVQSSKFEDGLSYFELRTLNFEPEIHLLQTCGLADF